MPKVIPFSNITQCWGCQVSVKGWSTSRKRSRPGGRSECLVINGGKSRKLFLSPLLESLLTVQYNYLVKHGENLDCMGEIHVPDFYSANTTVLQHECKLEDDHLQPWKTFVLEVKTHSAIPVEIWISSRVIYRVITMRLGSRKYW